MFLTRLVIENIRSIGSLEIDFEQGEANRPWTYLLGENGTGKSSILRSIALAMAGSDALTELAGDCDAWIRLGKNEARIAVYFTTGEKKKRHVELNFVRGVGIKSFLEGNKASLDQLDAAVEKSGRNYFMVGYGVSRRTPGDNNSTNIPTSRYIHKRAQAVATMFSQEAVLVPLTNWAMDLDYRRGPSGLKPVQTALHTLLPDMTFSGIDKERRQLSFETPDGRLPLEALSDGYQAMAAWCGDLLFRITETFHDYKDPLKARGVLLIDEIDIHLHPKWQRQLVSFLKQTLPNFQIVVTTHSPLTVHQASEGELILLQRVEGSGVTAMPFQGAPNRMMLHQLLQSPVFGLESLDSPQVEAKREELRVLQGVGVPGTPKPSTVEKRKIGKLKAELADVPNWQDIPPFLEHTNNLLERIATGLNTDIDQLIQQTDTYAVGVKDEKA